jgi:hypothetical protein
MSERPDYYKLLHVQPDAPEAVIKASYRRLMQRLGMHPDLGGDHATAVLLNEAFRTLSDPSRRAAYDRARADGAAKPAGTRRADAANVHRPDTPLDLPSCPFCVTTYQPSQPADPEAACLSCGAPLAPAQRALPDEQSRRALDRLPRHMALTFLASTARQRRLNGITLDLSPAGMRFLAVVHLLTGDRVLIDCGFCSAVGIVRSVHHRAGDPYEWEVGVQFVTMRLKRQRGSLIWTNA